MKKLSFIILLAGGTFAARPVAAQTGITYVIASAGGIATAPNSNTVSFTLGEVFVATVGTSPQFTQGFQQPVVPSNPLPVTLVDFSGTAYRDHNQLRWQTAMEKNNHYFVVERGADGRNFEPVGTVYSKAEDGNSTVKLAYEYTDRSMTANVNYYRLRQVDRDGTAAYSDVVKLISPLSEGGWAVFPNPATDKIRVLVKELSPSSTIRIYDLSGKEVKRITLQEQETEIGIGQLSAGVYFLEYATAQGTETRKLVKQ